MVVCCQPYAPAAFTPRKYSWYSFLLETESTAEPYCDRKDFMSMKNPLTPAGIEPGTLRFVSQHLNHCATAVLLHLQTSHKCYVQELIFCSVETIMISKNQQQLGLCIRNICGLLGAVGKLWNMENFCLNFDGMLPPMPWVLRAAVLVKGMECAILRLLLRKMLQATH